MNNYHEKTAKTQGKYRVYVAIISGAFALIVALVNIYLSGQSDKQTPNNSKKAAISKKSSLNELNPNIQTEKTNITTTAKTSENKHESIANPNSDDKSSILPSKVFTIYIEDTFGTPIDSAKVSIIAHDTIKRASGFSDENGWCEIEIPRFPRSIKQVEISCQKKGFIPQKEWTDVLNAKKNFELETK